MIEDILANGNENKYLFVYTFLLVVVVVGVTILWINIMLYDNMHIFKISTQMVLHLIQQNLVTIWRKIILS